VRPGLSVEVGATEIEAAVWTRHFAAVAAQHGRAIWTHLGKVVEWGAPPGRLPGVDVDLWERVRTMGAHDGW
jgi:hypothetical protein